MSGLRVVFLRDIREQTREIDLVGLRMIWDLALPEILHPANQIIESSDAEGAHQFTHFLGNSVEIIHDVFRLAFEFGAQPLILSSHTDRTGVEMTLPDVYAARRNEGGCPKVKFLGSQQGSKNDILAGSHASIGAEGDSVAQAVQHEYLMSLSDPQFP